ncbi:MAG: hypothetical protein ACKOE6_06005 [Flammeovirgaceae bacterium]
MTLGIFDHEFVTCQLDESVPVLLHRWKQAPPPEEFMFTLKRILEEYKTHKHQYPKLAWMVDAALLGELDEQVENWLVNDWEKMLFEQAGVRVHAVILGQDIFADYPIEKFKQDAERKFEKFNVHLGVFSNRDEAYHWMKKFVI